MGNISRCDYCTMPLDTYEEEENLSICDSCITEIWEEELKQQHREYERSKFE